VNQRSSSYRQSWRRGAIFATAWLLASSLVSSAELDQLQTMFETYCFDCHGTQNQKADRRFDAIWSDPFSTHHLLLFEEALDAMNLGAMPPQESGVMQPSDEERRRMIATLTRHLDAASASQRVDETLLRRLTRYEYNYTLRDLLGVRPEALDATKAFPPEQPFDGFANVGESQTLSQQQLELYLEAARTYLDQAIYFGRERPQRQSWKFPPSDFTQSKSADARLEYRVLDQDERYVDFAHGEPADRRPNAPRSLITVGIPFDGFYKIRVTAEAIRRLDHPYDPEVLRYDLSQPMKLGVWCAPDVNSLQETAIEARRLVAVFDLLDGQAAEFEANVWMNQGAIPFINWLNGPGSAKGPISRVMEKYHPDGMRFGPVEVDELRSQGIEVSEAEIERRSHIFASDFYQGPRMRVYDMTMEGPLEESWPPASHRLIFGETMDPHDVNVAAVLTKFANRAFRRPVTTAEISHYIHFVNQRIADGIDRVEAIKQGLTAMLSSPKFLFLDEGRADEHTELDDFELASRLSYFLWSSMPDDDLRQAAASGELRDPEQLRAQVERLLKDSRSDALVAHFTDAWLRLDKLGSMPPGVKEFPDFFRYRLEAAMKTETRLFFAHLLHHNRNIREFLDADYSFLNDSLAMHYGIDNVDGEAFRKVVFPKAVRRGGLLGHASVLTATANGVETSPVVRGVWLLESVLGTPPSPPPADVPAIEPDTRGALTIRDQLEKHRQVAACADCHAKIDPWGFALEFYDPVGAFRTHYPKSQSEKGAAPLRRDQKPNEIDSPPKPPKGQTPSRIGSQPILKPIDGAGQLPSGETIRDERDLKRALIRREQQFCRNLAEKMLTYATGRTLTYRDSEAVNRIVDDTAAAGGGLKDLVHRVIHSETFHQR